MAKNSRRIGATTELEAAGRMNRLFGTSFYRSQQFKGTADSSDIIDDTHPELSVEVKRDSSFSIKLHRAIEKSREEAADDSTALVLHRHSGERWLATVDFFELPELVVRLAAILTDGLPADEDWNDGGLFAALLEDAQENQVSAEAEGINGKRKAAGS